jgi:hypothetical protein
LFVWEELAFCKRIFCAPFVMEKCNTLVFTLHNARYKFTTIP